MTGARPDTWMPVYIGDYLADTMHLSYAEHGAYMLLIFAYWRRGAALPNDDRLLAGICKATAKQWSGLRPVLIEFFQIEDGAWRHKRIDEELGRAAGISESRRKAGQAGGMAARGKSGRKIIANDIANELQKNTPSPSPSQAASEVTNVTSSAAAPPPTIPGSHERYPEVCQAVLGLLGDKAANAINLNRIDAWLRAGADPGLDICPTVQRLLPRWDSGSIKFFERAIMDSLASRTAPVAEGQAKSQFFNPVEAAKRLAAQ